MLKLEKKYIVTLLVLLVMIPLSIFFVMKQKSDNSNIKVGARPLRRAIQRYVEDEISEMILKGEILDGQTVTVDLENDKLLITTKK